VNTKQWNGLHPPFNRLTAGIVFALYGAILPTR
jgi:hypothetical protein